MALIETHCKTCGGDFKLDVGDKTVEQVQKLLESRTEFECHAGHHFEMDSPANHWVLGKMIEGSALSEEDWFTEMTKRYGRLMTTDEMQIDYEVQGFAYGVCVAKNKKTKQDVCLDFTTSPKGERYYHE